MFRGVFTPMITVFDNNGDIDFKGNEQVINKLIQNGVNGILFLGSIGEFINLTLDEKKKFIDFAVATVNKRVQVFIGTGETMVDEVVELTRYAESAGADAAVVITPYYFKLDDESIYRYYAEVAQSVNMSVILYNFPDRTAVSLGPELVLRLARDFKNIIGIKDTVDNISHTRKLINTIKPEVKDFRIFSGYDEYLIPNLMAGGDGLIGGLSNVVPELFTKLYKAYNEQDFETVDALQKKVYMLMDIYDASQPFVGAIKAAVSLKGANIVPMVRKPAGALNERQLLEIKGILNKAGF